MIDIEPVFYLKTYTMFNSMNKWSSMSESNIEYIM